MIETEKLKLLLMEKLNRKNGDGFSEIINREIGYSNPRKCFRRIVASEGLVQKLDAYEILKGHDGCVNAIEFNSAGDLLVSGSDDREIRLWKWETRKCVLSYPSGHWENVFQTKFMPLTDDRKIVTSAADGQVRLGEMSEDGQVVTKRLGKHHGRVYKLAVEPGSPDILYSCGEDGLVQQFDLRSNSPTKLFFCCSFTKSCRKHPNRIRLNAITIDPGNPVYFAVGGSDEYARVYDTRRCEGGTICCTHSDKPVNTFCPRSLYETNSVHITGLSYSKTSELLVSYNDELIYLFQKNMGFGSSPVSLKPEKFKEIEEPQFYAGHRNAQTVKGVNFFGPNDEYVASGSDCGNIFVWSKKSRKLVRLMAGDRRVVNHIEGHPYLPVLATCGIENNVKLWAPISDDVLPLPENAHKIMESNRQGREDHSRVTLTPNIIMHVLSLERRQASSYVERRYDRSDIVDTDEEGEDEATADILGFLDVDEMSTERDCNIS